MTPSRKTDRFRFLWDEPDSTYRMWKFRYCALAFVLALALVGFFVVIGAISTVVSIQQCAQTGRLYGLAHHWTVFSGCFLRLPDGHYVTTGAYQAFQQVKR